MNSKVAFFAFIIVAIIVSAFFADDALLGTKAPPQITSKETNKGNAIVVDRTNKGSTHVTKQLQEEQVMPKSSVQKFIQALEEREPVISGMTNRRFEQVDFNTNEAQDTLRVSSTFGGIFLQAPHSIADRYTGEIVETLTNSTLTIDAIFINQRHRREFDYSRNGVNILSDFSLAYLARTKGGIVVQIHGFAKEKRKSTAAANAHFILSSGHKGVLKLPTKFSKCLQDNGFSGVKVFGKDVDELGATRNAVKTALYENRFHQFLHIEMSLTQRLTLRKSLDARNRFSQCLATLVGG